MRAACVYMYVYGTCVIHVHACTRYMYKNWTCRHIVYMRVCVSYMRLLYSLIVYEYVNFLSSLFTLCYFFFFFISENGALYALIVHD